MDNDPPRAAERKVTMKNGDIVFLVAMPANEKLSQSRSAILYRRGFSEGVGRSNYKIGRLD